MEKSTNVFVQVRMSKDQQEVTLDHFLNDSEMGILKSEYRWIHHHVTEYLSSTNRALLKIVHAQPLIDELAWRVEVEVKGEEAKETQENEVGHIHIGPGEAS